MKMLERSENAVGNGEIARYKQCPVFPQLFKNLVFVNQHFSPFSPLCFLPLQKQISLFEPHLTLSKASPGFYVCSTSLLKTLEKEKLLVYEQFLLFPQCFLPVLRAFCHFQQN